MSIEAIKLAAEFNRYFTSANGVDVPAKVSVSRDEWRALFIAIQQAEAQQPATGEPVYWEWRHLSTHPDTVDFGKWSEWKRVEARGAIHTIDDALAEFRTYIAQGYKYELRALYDRPAPSVPSDVVRDAERYRWLRSLEHCNEAWCLIGSGNANSNLDAAIDAAMPAPRVTPNAEITGSAL